LSFKGRGFSFIPVREAHIDFIAASMGRTAPDFDRLAGNCMVNRDYLPLGFCLAYFADDDIVEGHAYFGNWLRIFPKDILRSMNGFMDQLRINADVSILYAAADENIDGADTLLKWLKGEPTGKFNEVGEIYEIDIRKSKI